MKYGKNYRFKSENMRRCSTQPHPPQPSLEFKTRLKFYNNGYFSLEDLKTGDHILKQYQELDLPRWKWNHFLRGIMFKGFVQRVRLVDDCSVIHILSDCAVRILSVIPFRYPRNQFRINIDHHTVLFSYNTRKIDVLHTFFTLGYTHAHKNFQTYTT